MDPLTQMIPYTESKSSVANQRFGRKANPCSAEGEPVRKPSVCSPTRVYAPRLSAHPASAKVVHFQRPTRFHSKTTVSIPESPSSDQKHPPSIKIAPSHTHKNHTQKKKYAHSCRISLQTHSSYIKYQPGRPENSMTPRRLRP